MPIQCKPMHCEGDLSSFKWKTHHKINTSLLMLREWTYTASSRDALGNTSPSALEISLGRGFCTPRPSRFPSGFALGKSLGPRGAKSPPLGNLSGLGGCISQYIPPLGSVRIHSLIISREVLILTLSIFNALNVCISWYSLCPRECTEKYFPRECISRTLPRENIGDTSSRGKHWQCSSNDESSSLMICRRQAKCQDNGCNEKINTWTL